MSRTLKKLIKREELTEDSDIEFIRNFGRRGVTIVMCDECGKRFRSRYKPSRGKPFLCRECTIRRYSNKKFNDFQ